MGAVTRKLDICGNIGTKLFLFWWGEPTSGLCSGVLDTFCTCDIYFYTNAFAYMGLYICHKFTTISALIIRCIEESILKSPAVRGGAFGNAYCSTNRKVADSIPAVLTQRSIQSLTEMNNNVIF